MKAKTKKKKADTKALIRAFIRGYEMGNSNQISLPDALQAEFGSISKHN